MLRLSAMLCGVLLDWLLGDPEGLPHPVRLMGGWIACAERLLLPREKSKKARFAAKKGYAPDTEEGQKKGGHTERKGMPPNAGAEFAAGCLSVISLLCLTAGAVLGVLRLGDLAGARLHARAVLSSSFDWTAAIRFFLHTIMTWQILAAGSLYREGRRVRLALTAVSAAGGNDKANADAALENARRAVGRIVGRDTDVLDAEGIVRAAVETVAESTTDGVVAPFVYLALFGVVGGFLYKAVNTLDSMIGYHSERYEYFGKAAARLDDLCNYLPARLAAAAMLLSCAVLEAAGKAFRGGSPFCTKNALRIWKRDGRKHESPNAGQTESVCAGALGLRLAGDTAYGGRLLKKPYIGDALKTPSPQDIRQSCRLMFGAEAVCLTVYALCVTAAIYIPRL